MISREQLLVIGGMAWLLCADAASAQSPSAPEGFSVFRLVRSRYIFDPERRAVRSEASPAPRAQGAASRTNFIAVTGTMVTAARTLAFFSGSQPEYSKVIPVGEKIGDFKITAITPAQVELERGGQPIIVPVGRQVPLDGSTTAILPMPVGTTPDASIAPPASGSTSAAPAPSTDKSETVRRMIERRQKEISK